MTSTTTDLSIHVKTDQIQTQFNALTLLPVHMGHVGLSVLTVRKTSHEDALDPLDRAINAGNQRVQQANEQILARMLEVAENVGRNRQRLEDENVRLSSEIDFQKRRIELLEAVHQEKWKARLEATKIRMRAISSEISKIIQSIEAFQAEHTAFTDAAFYKDDACRKLMQVTPIAVICKVRGALTCQISHLHYFKDWLKLTERHPGEYPKYMGAATLGRSIL